MKADQTVGIKVMPVAAQLTPYVAAYLHFTTGPVFLRGQESPSVGTIKCMLHGRLEYEDDAARAVSSDIAVSGPGSRAYGYQVAGPITLFVAALTPLGWGALTRTSARDYRDRTVAGESLWGPDARALLAGLRSDADADAMAVRMDSFLLSVLQPPPPSHVALCAAVRAWIAKDRYGQLDVSDLFTTLPLSERHVLRLVARYYGGPPKMIARKYRALKAAACLLRGENISEVALSFYDQSHMIGEIKQFTGHTPGRLADDLDPAMTVILLGDDFARSGPYWPDKAAQGLKQAAEDVLTAGARP